MNYFKTFALWTALIWLAVNGFWGVLAMPMPHDEMFYKILVRNILEKGWPERPNGQLYLLNPPLAYYLQAWGERLFSANLSMTRFWHLAVFVVPILLGVMRLSRQIFGPPAALGALWLFALCGFFIEEAIPAEIDMPLACFTLLTVFGMIRVQQGDILRGYLVAVVALVLAAWTKFFQSLVLVPLFFILETATPASGRKRLMRLAGVVLALVTAYMVWAVWASLHGDSLFKVVSGASNTITHGSADWTDQFSRYGILRYNFMVALHVGLPLFFLIALALFNQWRRWRQLLLPAGLVAGVMLAMGLSHMRVFRYFDQALPLAVLLAAGALAPGSVVDFSGRARRVFWSVTTGLLALFGAQVLWSEPLVWQGLQIEPYKLVFLGTVLVQLVLLILQKGPKRQTFGAVLAVYLLLSLGLFSADRFPVLAFSQHQRVAIAHEEQMGRKLAQLMRQGETVASNSHAVIYYAHCDYLLMIGLNSAMKKRFLEERFTYVVIEIDSWMVVSEEQRRGFEEILREKYRIAEGVPHAEGLRVYKIKAD